MSLQQYLDVIRRNAQREMRLVGDLLLLVRIQEGTFRIELEEVDLRRIVEQAVEAARPAASKREIELTAEAHPTPPHPPPEASPLQITPNPAPAPAQSKPQPVRSLIGGTIWLQTRTNLPEVL